MPIALKWTLSVLINKKNNLSLWIHRDIQQKAACRDRGRITEVQQYTSLLALQVLDVNTRQQQSIHCQHPHKGWHYVECDLTSEQMSPSRWGNMYFVFIDFWSILCTAMYYFIHLYPHVAFMNVTLKHINLDDWPVINNTSFLAVTYRCNWIDSVLLWLFDLYSKGKSWYQTSYNDDLCWNASSLVRIFFRKQLIANR